MTDKKTLPSTLFNMALILTIVAGISALILAYVHETTKGPIQKAKDLREMQAVAEVIAEKFDNNPFAEKTVITAADGNGRLELYPTRLNGIINGMAIKTYTNKAFGGRMELIVGFSLDGRLTGYKVIDHKETPGLGTKVIEEKFSSQFRNIYPSYMNFKVRQDGGDIDAVTAATISSRAVIDAVQRAIDAYNKFSAGN